MQSRELSDENEFEGDVLECLRQKWSEIPAGLTNRLRTDELADLSDEELLSLWEGVRDETTRGPGFSARGWYHELYKDFLRGKKMLDVGSGLGIDGLTFASHGARVTFVDIVESNLRVLERLCRIQNIDNTNFLYLENLSSLDALDTDYDVIWCQGSMINAPFSFAQREADALLSHLPVGGRWIELAYPRERWEREGRLDFSKWGKITDGEATPWMEWYDLDRLKARLQGAQFDVILSFNFHNNDFNWFDLIRVS